MKRDASGAFGWALAVVGITLSIFVVIVLGVFTNEAAALLYVIWLVVMLASGFFLIILAFLRQG